MGKVVIVWKGAEWSHIRCWKDFISGARSSYIDGGYTVKIH